MVGFTPLGLENILNTNTLPRNRTKKIAANKTTNMKLIYLSLFILFQGYCHAQTAESYYELSNEKAQLEEWEYALVLMEKAIALDSLNLGYRFSQARILYELKRYADYEELLKDMLEIEPEDALIYNLLGNLYMSSNQKDKALNHFTKAIEYAKSDSVRFVLHVNRATAKGRFRDFDGATNDFEQALAIDSNDLALLNNLANIYDETGRVEDAIQMLKRIILLDSTFIGSYVNLGFIYSRIDSLDLSEYYYDQALAINPKEPIILNNKGHLHYKKGEYRKALQLINESIDAYPSNAYAYRNRALVYLALDLKKEACRELSIAEHYDFKLNYGNEVSELLEAHCKD